MKKILYSLLAFCILLVFNSCNDEITKTLTGQYIGLDGSSTNFLYLRTGNNQPVDMGATVKLIAAPQSSDINYSFEIVDSLTNAIENLHYTVASNTGSIAAGEVSGIIPIMINPDNIELEEELTITVVLTSSDIDLANDEPVTYNLGVTCESALEGMVDYVHSDNFTGTTLTGTVEISLKGMTPGIYFFDDFSFGGWAEAYGIDPPTGNLEFSHICGVIALTGTDNYGDVWQIDELLESDGPTFSFKWSNTYDEFGTVSLTRQDGQDWPLFVF